MSLKRKRTMVGGKYDARLPAHPICKACGWRFDWYPETARENWKDLRKGGQVDADGLLSIPCPHCGQKVALRLPGDSGLGRRLR